VKYRNSLLICTNSNFRFFSSLYLIIFLCSSIRLTQFILLQSIFFRAEIYRGRLFTHQYTVDVCTVTIYNNWSWNKQLHKSSKCILWCSPKCYYYCSFFFRLFPAVQFPNTINTQDFLFISNTTKVYDRPRFPINR
jgi:hypothetical protein